MAYKVIITDVDTDEKIVNHYFKNVVMGGTPLGNKDASSTFVLGFFKSVESLDVLFGAIASNVNHCRKELLDDLFFKDDKVIRYTARHLGKTADEVKSALAAEENNDVKDFITGVIEFLNQFLAEFDVKNSFDDDEDDSSVKSVKSESDKPREKISKDNILAYILKAEKGGADD